MLKSICIYLFVLLFPCITVAQTEDTDTLYDSPPPPPPLLNSKESDQKCHHNGRLTAKERRCMYPFSNASKVKVICYPWFDGEVIPPIDSLLPLIIEEITLSEKQINKLTDILYNYNYSRKTKLKIQVYSVCGCPEMRHAILFIDNKEDIISYMHIDLINTHFETDSPDEYIGDFCEGKYKLLESFFKSVGIKHFDDKVKDELDIDIEELIPIQQNE